MLRQRDAEAAVLTPAPTTPCLPSRYFADRQRYRFESLYTAQPHTRSICTTHTHRNHGSYILKAFRQAVGKEGDAYSHGRFGRCWKDDHSVQAEAR
jgi:hypothetical protein